MERVTFTKTVIVPGTTREAIEFREGEKLWVVLDGDKWAIFNNALDAIPLTRLSSSELKALDLEWSEGSTTKNSL